MATLPLFPLGTVLLPGAKLPLQIFEPRYVALLRDLVDSPEAQSPVFGVVAIREGFEVGEDGVRALHPVGCAAVVTQTAALMAPPGLPQQRFVIVSYGTTRFTLDSVHDPSPHPYLTGEVTWLDEPDGDASSIAELAGRLQAQLATYRATVHRPGDDELAEPPEEPNLLSYFVPQAVELGLGERQALLASTDTESRLRLGLRLVRREIALARSFRAVSLPPSRPLNLN